MKKAFTLAEILITLSIIGVIASMTIPSLVQDVQDAQLKTAWKKAYADLEQITRRIMLDNGGNFKSFINNANTLHPQYTKFFNYTKICPSYTAGCWHNTVKELSNKVYVDNQGIFDNGGFILNNGNLITFENCPPYDAILWVDVNGWKGPNTFGKDVFGIRINTSSIKPLGSQGDIYENTCNATGTGIGCSAKYLYQ